MQSAWKAAAANIFGRWVTLKRVEDGFSGYTEALRSVIDAASTATNEEV